MEDIIISKNFVLHELVHSDTAEKYKIDNTPTPEVVENLKNLITVLIQPLRDKINRPFYISSGYRSPKLNFKVGGSATSSHLTGEAIDFTLGSPMLNRMVLEEIERNHQKWDFDQCIDEWKGKTNWIHLSCKKDLKKNRHQIFTIRK